MPFLVESYDDDSSVVVDGQSYPAECQVEDDDGIRIAILRSLSSIPIKMWQRLHHVGVTLVVAPEGEKWEAAILESYRPKQESGLGFGSEEDISLSGRKVVMEGFPTHAAYLKALDAEEQGGFVSLHTHSEFSALDGMSEVEEMVKIAVADNQRALAITDHGTCASHPLLQKEAESHGIKPIFGIEANFTDDRLLRGDKEVKGDAQRVLNDYYHLILWAMDERGLRNLWALSTDAYREGFYGRPRMDWDSLEAHNEGLMVSTACLRGPVAKPILADDEQLARANLARLLGIFGDRLYIEIQTTKLEEQTKVNHALVGLAGEYEISLIAAVDSHYPTIDDRQTHRVWIAAQTNKDLMEDADLFAGDSDYHMMTEEEVRKALADHQLDDSVIDEAIANTVMVADRCEAKIEGKDSAPIFSKADDDEQARQRDLERLVDLCMENWSRCLDNENPEAIYLERFEREMTIIRDAGFCGYFLMVSDYVRWARDHGILVGPGRGSGSGSLVAYLSDIIGIDPIDADLMFERFLTPGRKSLPDFDVDFPRSKRGVLADYITDRYGEESVIRVGTNIRLKSKGVVRDLARVLKGSMEIHYPDINAVCKIIDEAESDKAGLGMDWEDLWEEYEDELGKYRTKYPELFGYADKLVGKLKTYGKHAAGLVISTDMELTSRLPLRSAGDDIVAEFDMESLEELGLVKFDLLTLRTLDTIQECVDRIERKTGERIKIDDWEKEYLDPQVWEEISDGHTLGMFQIETSIGTTMTKRMKPTSLDELADVITLVRPGPMRSGLTETYFRRREGGEGISYIDSRLEPILSKTYGAMIYQEQVMQTCMAIAGYDSREADTIRKILGKKQIEKVTEAGQEFRRRAKEKGTDPAVAETLWDQMAEFARYSFNRSHAYGYAMLGYWCAWFKVHYPGHFLASVMSTVDKGRIPEFIQEARRIGYKVLPPEINASGEGFAVSGTEIRYGFDGVKGIGRKAVQALMEGQPYQDWDDFMERKGSKANQGIVQILAKIGAFPWVENRRELEEKLEREADGSSTRCVHWDDETVGPNGLPCTFDWENEPLPISDKTGRKLKQKPIPKRCTIRCRNYTPPEWTFEGLDLTPREIMEREMELLGIHLSHTPFDNLPEYIWDADIMQKEMGMVVSLGREVRDGGYAGPTGNGIWTVVATLTSTRPHTTKTGDPMGFINVYAVDADLSMVVFPGAWEAYQPDLRKGELYIIQMRKNERGLQLINLQPIGVE